MQSRKIPTTRQPRHLENHRWQASQDKCAANLSFSTSEMFLTWVESDMFKPFYEEFVEMKKEHPKVKFSSPIYGLAELETLYDTLEENGREYVSPP